MTIELGHIVGDVANTVLAIAALVMVYLTVRSHRQTSESLEIERSRERERQVDLKRAKLIASMERVVLTTYNVGKLVYFVRIQNYGVAEARDVTVSIRARRFRDDTSIVDIAEQARLPVSILGPGAHWEYNGSGFTLFEVDIAWTDCSGKPGKHQTQLIHP